MQYKTRKYLIIVTQHITIPRLKLFIIRKNTRLQNCMDVCIRLITNRTPPTQPPLQFPEREAIFFFLKAYSQRNSQMCKFFYQTYHRNLKIQHNQISFLYSITLLRRKLFKATTSRLLKTDKKFNRNIKKNNNRPPSHKKKNTHAHTTHN